MIEKLKRAEIKDCTCCWVFYLQKMASNSWKVRTMFQMWCLYKLEQAFNGFSEVADVHHSLSWLLWMHERWGCLKDVSSDHLSFATSCMDLAQEDVCPMLEYTHGKGKSTLQWRPSFFDVPEHVSLMDTKRFENFCPQQDIHKLLIIQVIFGNWGNDLWT